MSEVSTIRLPVFSRLKAIPPAAPIIVLYLILGALVPAFLSPANITSILFTVAALLPAVLGIQLLLVLGRFDLSIGATAGLAGIISALCLNRFGSATLAVIIGILVGAGVGFLISLLVARFAIDPLIATLGVMGIGRSLSLVVNGGRIVASLPPSFGWIVDRRIAGLPLLIWFAFGFAFIAAMAANHVIVFRRFYAAGSNPIAASHSGIKVTRLITFGYILAGIGAALTGLVQIARTLSASPLIFESLAIEAITACIIGGGSLAGGRGGILGAATGLLVVAATDNLVVLLDVSVYWKDLAIGVLLLLVVIWPPIAARVRGRFKNNLKVEHK